MTGGVSLIAGRRGAERQVQGPCRARGRLGSAQCSIAPSGLHTGLGQRDSALRYLDRAYEERSTVLAYLLIDPTLAPFRGEPRFLALARRLGGE